MSASSSLLGLVHTTVRCLGMSINLAAQNLMLLRSSTAAILPIAELAVHLADVDGQLDAGYVTGLIRGQPGHCVCDVLGLAHVSG